MSEKEFHEFVLDVYNAVSLVISPGWNKDEKVLKACRELADKYEWLFHAVLKAKEEEGRNGH